MIAFYLARDVALSRFHVFISALEVRKSCVDMIYIGTNIVTIKLVTSCSRSRMTSCSPCRSYSLSVILVAGIVAINRILLVAFGLVFSFPFVTLGSSSALTRAIVRGRRALVQSCAWARRGVSLSCIINTYDDGCGWVWVAMWCGVNVLWLSWHVLSGRCALWSMFSIQVDL